LKLVEAAKAKAKAMIEGPKTPNPLRGIETAVWTSSCLDVWVRKPLIPSGGLKLLRSRLRWLLGYRSCPKTPNPLRGIETKPLPLASLQGIPSENP